MSNPLNDQIAQLIAEITKLEQQRDKAQQALDDIASPSMFLGYFESLKPERQQVLRPKIQLVETLDKTIDSKRQKLISLELLALDNSIKSLHSTTNQMLTSSTKLEYLTRLLIMVTVFLGIVAILNVAVTFLPTNPYVGFVGMVATLAAMIYLWIRIVPILRHKQQ